MRFIEFINATSKCRVNKGFNKKKKKKKSVVRSLFIEKKNVYKQMGN